jgi:hypothetical protein
MSTPCLIRGTHANLSGLTARKSPLILAWYPQLSAVPSGGNTANVSEGTLITRGFGSGGICYE